MRLLLTMMFAPTAEKTRCPLGFWATASQLEGGQTRIAHPAPALPAPQVGPGLGSYPYFLYWHKRVGCKASAFPTSATTPLLESNILECLPVIHKRLHTCLVIPFRPHLEPVRWTLPSLHFRKTWFREGERLARGHTARMQQSQDSNVCLNLQLMPLLPRNPVTSLGTEVGGWTPELPDQNPEGGSQESVFWRIAGDADAH